MSVSGGTTSARNIANSTACGFHFPAVPMLALTATATERVWEDILTQLQLKEPYLHVASFNRPNLFYDVRAKHKHSYAESVSLLREIGGISGGRPCHHLLPESALGGATERAPLA